MLEALATPWSLIEEFGGMADPDGLACSPRELQALARSAVSSGHNLYCWTCI